MLNHISQQGMAVGTATYSTSLMIFWAASGKRSCIEATASRIFFSMLPGPKSVAISADPDSA
jgi:hypothetical protein